ncbi:hypothetical protein G6F68_010214 [Rhizopus microsporus]|nr:hypothetical protein G6F68_010214 [Rhizopus microsporus]
MLGCAGQGGSMSGHNQFALLRQRRFLPFFVVQALGAFNDNVYRQAIISMLLFMAVPEEELGLYATLAPAIFILPYFLFSALAGQIADKLEKSRLIVITTTMEIVIMSLAATGFLTQSLPVLLIALFCTGMQSTLFGPVKYSVLPSVLKPEELTGGNGLVEMGTSMSILSGMIVGGLVFTVAGSHGTVVAACAIIGLAICGNIAARLIPKVDAGDPNLKINWNPLPESLAVLRMARQQKAVRNAILGVSWFWFVGTVLTSQLPAYAVTNLGGEPTLYIFALALFSVGTGVGSLLCEKLSARTVEIGLVPLGAFGMTAFLLDLYFARSGEAAPPHRHRPDRHRPVHRHLRGAAVRADPEPHAEGADVTRVRGAEHPEFRVHRRRGPAAAGRAQAAALDHSAAVPGTGHCQRAAG